MRSFTNLVRAMFRRSGKVRRSPVRTKFRLLALEARDVPSAYGDFNGDGYSDLAIGVPGEDGGAGAVNVLYGTGSGLSAVGSQYWRQSGINEFSEANDRFGTALAVGDFNGDGFDDLAIGVPGEDGRAGAVNVLRGSLQRLVPTFDPPIRQGVGSFEDVAEPDDEFGFVLAAGDFNDDGYADLAVGVPGEDIGSITDAGAVHVVYGGDAGLMTGFDKLWSQDNPGVPGHAQVGDEFGSALAVGDFNGDGEDDLAIGAPSEDDEDGTNEVNVGAVVIIHGAHGPVYADGGLSTAIVPAQLWTQDSSGIEGTEEAQDLFGYALAAGDFNGDFRDDLAIGVPGEDVNGIVDAGAVNVIYGSASGLTSANDQLWHQDSASVEDIAASGDFFGSALAAGNFNGDGADDLAVGVMSDDLTNKIRTVQNAGAVNVIYGWTGTVSSPNGGLSATITADQHLHQDWAGVEDVAETSDLFGYALAVGDFNGDGKDDLAIGVIGEDVNGYEDAGAVNVLYGSTTVGLTSNLDQFWHQGSPGIVGGLESYDGFGHGLGKRR